MDEATLNELGNLFLALSDKTRLRLLSLMSDGEVSVGFLADSLGESQPKISRHLAYLRTAGLVSTRRDGKWIYYSLQLPDSAAASGVLIAALRPGSASAPREDRYIPPVPEYAQDTFDESNMNDWRPEEMEVYLL